MALVSEHSCLPTVVFYSLALPALPFPGYPWGRALCVRRSARRVQPESQGDLPHGRLSTPSCGSTCDWHHSWAKPYNHGKSKKYNSRTRQSPGLDSSGLMTSLPHLNQLVPSRRMAFLSPTQNWNTQKSSNLIVALNKGYLSFWCTEKLWFFSWDFSHFYLTLLVRCFSYFSLYANLTKWLLGLLR